MDYQSPTGYENDSTSVVDDESVRVALDSLLCSHERNVRFCAQSARNWAVHFAIKKNWI